LARAPEGREKGGKEGNDEYPTLFLLLYRLRKGKISRRIKIVSLSGSTGRGKRRFLRNERRHRLGAWRELLFSDGMGKKKEGGEEEIPNTG